MGGTNLDKMASIPYEYHNLPIPGGGYVTGFSFHQNVAQILYARTDVGGVYRYDYKNEKWQSLMNHVTMNDLSESFPIAIALDPKKAEKIFIACGVNEPNAGVLAISEDYGQSFTYEKVPTLIHGNLNGRGTGTRLIVDVKDSNTLYFASQEGGLLQSKDGGKNWTVLDVHGEAYMTCVWQSEDGEILIVGTAGVTTKVNENLRGHSLYVSYNQGQSFEKLSQPESKVLENSRLSGYVAQHIVSDDQYIYVTLSNTGQYSYVVENGYSCDSGDAMGGKVIRYSLQKGKKLEAYEDITPTDAHEEGEDYSYGMSGISTSKAAAGTVVCSTICRKEAGKDLDYIMLSKDYGMHWQKILYGLEGDNLTFHTPYMKPEYNGNQSIIHWISDVKINPFNPDELWFNTGTGIFKTSNLTSYKPCFEDCCKGLEETVHLNVYAPPSGRVKLIDILGDLGGFAFEDIDKPCENSFADDAGNRYITCINADYSDEKPETLIVTARGNWTGKTKGGLILSKDQGKSFNRLKMPYGISHEIDEKLHQIECPNVNAGWVSLSADCNNIVWSIADCIELPKALVVTSQDGGQTFTKTKIYDLNQELTETGGMKVFADRVASDLMYGFGSESQLYISQDGGLTFYEQPMPEAFPKVNFALIDCANKTEIRGESGKVGQFYIAMGSEGLWKMSYQPEEGQISFKRLSAPEDQVYRIGLGILRPDGDYFKEDKALYICGKLSGAYGFYRSLDEGKSWTKLNTANQMFGDINSVEGDSRVFGRFFIATGSRGVIYGEEKGE